MTDKQEDLNKYRQEIDTIDDKMHQLLLQRTELAGKIAVAKGKTTGLAIRPNREAFIHRRLLKNHHGDFPFASLARMWREMINAFTLLQADYELAVYVQQGDMRCWEVARDQFGSIVKMTAYDSVEKTVAQAENNNKTIAIVPASGIIHIQNTKVSLRLPFSGACDTLHSAYDVYGIAQLDAQPSEKDSTVYIGNTLPTDAEELYRHGNKIVYAIDGFSTDGIGIYPSRIHRK